MDIRLYVNCILILLLTGCTPPQKLLYNKKPAFYSYIIGNVKSNHIYEEYAADVYATPASCQKTITALVALKLFGPDYQYETKLYVTKKQKFTQDVVLSFSGDPTFTLNDLLALLKPIKGTKVNGKIILDTSIFKTPAHSPNIMIGDIGTDYAQPVSSSNIDKNLITVTVMPTKIGKRSFVTNDAGYKINSTVTTTLDVSAITLSWEGESIQAKGNINPNDISLEFEISPEKIDPYVLRKVAKALKALNINGKIKIINNNKLPLNLQLINTTKSKTLKEIISPALKQSDNLVLDSLYLKIIHSQSREGIENWEQGDKIIKDLIRQYFSIDMNKALFVDGSGLSRYNRIQPRMLLKILKQGFLVPEFTTALPRPGEKESTLEKRTDLPNKIRAKTGNMSGISCLCGYSIDSNRPKVFVFIANSFDPPSKELFEVMDKFIRNHLKNRCGQK